MAECSISQSIDARCPLLPLLGSSYPDGMPLNVLRLALVVYNNRWFKMKASYMSWVRRPRAQLRQRRLRSRQESRYWSVKTCVVRISRLHRLRPLLRPQNFLVPSRTKVRTVECYCNALYFNVHCFVPLYCCIFSPSKRLLM